MEKLHLGGAFPIKPKKLVMVIGMGGLARILIVDDDESIRKVLVTIWKKKDTP